MADLPRMTKTAYASNTTSLGNMQAAGNNFVTTTGGYVPCTTTNVLENHYLQNLQKMVANGILERTTQPKKEAKMAKPIMRVVKVFIADSDDNIPLEKRLLYTGEEKLTDATDQELFFEIDINNLLIAYNKYRVTVINKAIKERTELLEPVRIRDLKMTIVDIATF